MNATMTQDLIWAAPIAAVVALGFAFFKAIENGKNPFEVGFNRLFVLARERGQYQILQNGQVAEQPPTFRDVGDAQFADYLVGIKLEQVLTHEGHFGSRINRYQTRDCSQGGAFSSAIRPNDTDDLALIDLHRQGIPTTVLFLEFVAFVFERFGLEFGIRNAKWSIRYSRLWTLDYRLSTKDYRFRSSPKLINRFVSSSHKVSTAVFRLEERVSVVTSCSSGLFSKHS